VNDTFVQVSGYTRAEVIGRTPVELGLWVDPAQRNAGLAQLHAGDFPRNTEAQFRLKDGSIRTCLLSAELLALNGETCVVTVINDITERKQAEHRLQFLADVSTVLATSLEYEITLQQVAALMVPLLADFCTVELVGTSGGIESVASVHREPHKAQWLRVLRQRYPPALEESRGIVHVMRTGRAVFYPEIAEERLLQSAQDEEYKALLRQIGFHSVIIVPLPVRGQILGALTLVRATPDHRYTEADLQLAEEVARRAALAVDNARLYREAREAESQLKQLNATLERQVEERTAELQRSNQELNQFAYIASHDLKSPLRGIEHLANFIHEDAAAVLPEPSKKHLAMLRGRVNRMDVLLTDLLAYSRAGRQQHSLEQVDTAALIHTLVDLLAPPPGFTVSSTSPLPTLMTQRVALETVFRNLIGNAIKHHDRPAAGLVHISARPQGQFIEFVVADNGPGIAPIFHERIFTLFQTLKPRDQVEGSGIGLAVVRRLVESLGGQVWVESSLGQGATFRFTWPQAVGEENATNLLF
jgi:PAS domain S-box-containing protein